MAESKTHRGLILFSAFMMSFCSLGYQQTLALTLTDSTDRYVLSQAITLAIFVSGLGLGSWWSERWRGGWTTLLQVEWILSLAGALSVAWAHGCEMFLRSWFPTPGAWLFFVSLSPLIALLGFLTGAELPLLLRLAPHVRPGSVLACNYLGAFAATLLVPISLFPNLDTSGTALSLSVVNFAAATLILPKVWPAWTRLAHLALGVGLAGWFLLQPALNLLHLQWIYFTPRINTVASVFVNWDLIHRLGEPIRQRTRYQWIDILPPEFTDQIQGRQDFQLYLDRKIQFSSGSLQRYHESMVHGGINLLRRVPRRVLILGGGDGLLARNLLEYPGIESIDLVELDPQMIDLALRQKDLLRMNRQSLHEPRVHVHLEDAFQFIRHASEYDLVLVDLPFPVNFELSLLFTKEFYALAGRTLAPDGVLVLDFPLPGGRHDHLPDLIATLSAAGFQRPFAFGLEDFFVAVSRRSGDLAFRYHDLVPQVSNQTVLNLMTRSRDLAAAAGSGGQVNSVLKPILFGTVETWGAAKPGQSLVYQEAQGLTPYFLARVNEAWAGRFAHEMPLNFKKYWLETMSEERDFSEQLEPGLVWPRFQFGLVADDTHVKPTYQFFDVHNPARLRAEWSRAYCMSDPSEWIGVDWVADKSVVEFYAREVRANESATSSHLHIRRYEHGVFVGERPFDPSRFGVVGSVAPILRNSHAADLQSFLQREFLINPRYFVETESDQRIYFP